MTRFIEGVRVQLGPRISMEVVLLGQQGPRLMLRLQFMQVLVGPVLRFRPALSLQAIVARMLMACSWAAVLTQADASSPLAYQQ